MRKSTRGMKCSSETVRDALVMKMRCGTSGFAHLVKKIPIFPSVRSLQSYVQFVQFKCGILQEILDLMEAVVSAFNPFEKDCQLTLDEVAIEPSERFDFSTKSWVGKATLPSHVGIAKKALVFLLAVVTRRWKQVVAVFLTNHLPERANRKDNPTGKAMAGIIDEVVIKSEGIGLNVNGVTSDMGPDNLAWWKEKGINATRDGPVKCSFPHPARPDDELFVLPDVPHLFKATKKMMESNRTIRLPPDIVKQENLPSDIVDYAHIEDLCEFEGQFELKIAPKLKENTLHCNKQFAAMNVSTARAVVNNRTGAGLKRLSDVREDPSYLTTAWFVMLLNDFFTIVTSRCHTVALSQQNPSAYEKAINHLKKVSYVFRHMRVGAEGHWKPAQKDVLILVESILGLQKLYLEKKKYNFFLLGHLTQDCLENLFSCIRLSQAVSHALAFLQILEVITLAMYNSFVKNSSYDYDESAFMVDPLAEARTKAAERAVQTALKAKTEEEFNPVPMVTSEDLDSIPDYERSIIYDMAGSAIHSLKILSNKLCSTCLDNVLWKDENHRHHPYSSVTSLKEYVALKSDTKGDNLSQIEVSHECFVVVLIAEVTFRKIRSQTTRFRNVDVLQYLTNGLMYAWDGSSVPECHNIRRKILQCYLSMRMKQYGMKRTEELKATNHIDRSSKSIAMHQVAERL